MRRASAVALVWLAAVRAEAATGACSADVSAAIPSSMSATETLWTRRASVLFSFVHAMPLNEETEGEDDDIEV